MACKLIELDTQDGSTILVAVDVPETAVGRVSATDELPIEKVDRSFDAVKDLIVRGCHPLTQAFYILRRESQATEAEVEFGVKFTAKGSIYVVESTGQASLKIKVKWQLAAEGNK